MSFQLPDGEDLNKYSKVSIYLKNHPLNKLSIGGGLVSAYNDTYNITIKTNTATATFNADEITAIVFE